MSSKKNKHGICLMINTLFFLLFRQASSPFQMCVFLCLDYREVSRNILIENVGKKKRKLLRIFFLHDKFRISLILPKHFQVGENYSACFTQKKVCQINHYSFNSFFKSQDNEVLCQQCMIKNPFKILRTNFIKTFFC